MPDSAEPTSSHDSPWRQGHVLGADAVLAAGIASDDESATVLVIAHDCDIAAFVDYEPDVEVIVGRVVAVPNGNYTAGGSPRTLHLPIGFADATRHIELRSTDKRKVDKALLERFDPDPQYSLTGEGLRLLRSWLRARYDRAAFPDAFNERLSDCKLRGDLEKILAPAVGLVSAVFFDLDQGLDVERWPGDDYHLGIVLLYQVGPDAERSADDADALVERIEEACERRLSDGTAGIVIARCLAVSEDDLTVGQAKLLRQWRLEHLSFKARRR